MSVPAVLVALADASRAMSPPARLAGYVMVAGSLSKADLVKTVAVFAEGAMHGPESARALAAQIG